MTYKCRSDGPGLTIIWNILICIFSTEKHVTLTSMIYSLTYSSIYVAKRETSWRCYHNQLLIDTWFNKLNNTFLSCFKKGKKCIKWYANELIISKLFTSLYGFIMDVWTMIISEGVINATIILLTSFRIQSRLVIRKHYSW